MQIIKHRFPSLKAHFSISLSPSTSLHVTYTSCNKSTLSLASFETAFPRASDTAPTSPFKHSVTSSFCMQLSTVDSILSFTPSISNVSTTTSVANALSGSNHSSSFESRLCLILLALIIHYANNKKKRKMKCFGVPFLKLYFGSVFLLYFFNLSFQFEVV